MSMSVFSLLNMDVMVVPFQVQGSNGTYVKLPVPSCDPQVIGLAQSAFVPFQKLAERRDAPSLSPRSISQLRPDTDLPPLSQVLTSIGMATDEAVGQMGDAPADDSDEAAEYEKLKETARKRKEQRAAFRKAHSAELSARQSEYYEAHRAEILARQAEYRKAQRAKLAEKD